MKIRPLETHLFFVDDRINRYDEVNVDLSECFERSKNLCFLYSQISFPC